VIIKALQQAFPLLKEPPSSDICYATTNRQRAVRAIAPDADLVLVVGSRNSSNSVRLTEISENVGTKAKLIDDRSELRPEWFEGVQTVLITAGASAPEDLVHDLIMDLVQRFGGEVEQRDIYREEVEFGLPGTLKDLMRKRGVDPDRPPRGPRGQRPEAARLARVARHPPPHRRPDDRRHELTP